jgi:hypothetical protein
VIGPIMSGTFAGTRGAGYGSALSLSAAIRSRGAGGRLGIMKLSISTNIPKTTNPHAGRPRMPIPIEIDMKAMILKARVPLNLLSHE